MRHPAISKDFVAVITGGAAGIGFAAASRFSSLGLKVCIADLGVERLFQAANLLAALAPSGASSIMTQETDVSSREEVQKLKAAVHKRFGGTDILMNNAGIQPGSTMFGSPESWRHVLDVNLWGVINGTQVFLPDMFERGRPGLVINTGSKQGITTPPGDPAYNISKAGVKVFTEALAHELRNTPNCKVTAHLLIPGFVFTELTAKGRPEKPPGAWTADQTIDFAFKSIDAGDFYILCPDNEASRALDEKRILWGAGDIVENRPPLSRWAPAFADAFAQFLKKV
jgi:NAD(P)-dependent dehydrogenase (short-subunit alcohol dehydrogenase family)